ncbi:MAG: glycosyltransferase family 39 protein [Verrucomicrobiota bacterium]
MRHPNILSHSSPEPSVALPNSPAIAKSANDLREEPILASERWCAAALLAAAFLLRCWYILRFRYDSDEPQHLHTTWGWTQGMVQYRDFFDNHTPLFHFLFSPLVALFGERADILTLMRFAMVPLWFVSLGAVWWMGRELFSRRAALWATVLISLMPWWFFCALEYRTDNLWTPLWLCALALLLTGRLSMGRAFASGLLLGLAACTSMKTSLLVAVSAMAAITAPLVWNRRFDLRELGRTLRLGWPIAAGLLVAPAVLALLYWVNGNWQQFYYCVIQHNIVPGVDARNHPTAIRLIFPLALPFVLMGAARFAGESVNRSLGVRRAFLFLFAGLYYTALYSFWTLLTRQDYLPFYPVASLVAAPLLLTTFGRLNARFPGSFVAKPGVLLAFIGLVEIGLILGGRPPWIDGTAFEREALREVLALTKPGEFVMNFKGEAVFRKRPFYYVIEPLTEVRMRRGTIADDIPKRLIATHTNLVINQGRWYRKKTKSFLNENYLPIGAVRVAGKIISPAGHSPNTSSPVHFNLAVPASYVLWSSDGQPVHGQLDGTPYDGARELAAGSHEFQADNSSATLALVWARAIDAGFKPILDSKGWSDERSGHKGKF